MNTSTGMKEDTELLAIHHSRLVSWVVQQFGKALLIGTVTFLIAGVAIAAMSGDGGTAVVWGVGISFLAFAVYLAAGEAPDPLQLPNDD